MNYSILIFDFDGTLADTNEGIVKTYQETFRRLGMTVPSRERITATIGLAMRDAFASVSEEFSTPEAQDKVINLYRSIFKEIAYPVIFAFPGIVELVRDLKATGVKMAVATSRSHVSLEALAEQIGVAPYFDTLLGAEDVKHHKPSPDLALLALEKLGERADNALVIGDAVYDIQMGKGALCKTCAVSWGNQSHEKLSGADPDFIVDNVDELRKLLLG